MSSRFVVCTLHQYCVLILGVGKGWERGGGCERDRKGVNNEMVRGVEHSGKRSV